MDGHDRGARVVARALRDAGMEVIYTGRHVSMDFIARTAVQEDVDIIGLSILSGAHVALARNLMDVLRGIDPGYDVPIVVGGTISSRAVRDELLKLGVADVFPGGTSLPSVVDRVSAIGRRHQLGELTGTGATADRDRPDPET
jgi:methylmalonyl-CoA mutase C-terminal domain/subunit